MGVVLSACEAIVCPAGAVVSGAGDIIHFFETGSANFQNVTTGGGCQNICYALIITPLVFCCCLTLCVVLCTINNGTGFIAKLFCCGRRGAAKAILNGQNTGFVGGRISAFNNSGAANFVRNNSQAPASNIFVQAGRNRLANPNGSNFFAPGSLSTPVPVPLPLAYPQYGYQQLPQYPYYPQEPYPGPPPQYNTPYTTTVDENGSLIFRI